MALVANPLVFPITSGEISYVSGQVQLQSPGFQTGHGTGSETRSRRSNRSSSDEAPVRSWDGFLEEDLRAGGPDLPDLPCEKLPIPDTHSQYERLTGSARVRLCEDILKICRQYDLDILEVDFCGRRCTFMPTKIPNLTVLLLTRRKPHSAGEWIKAARAVRGLLHQKGIENINVEIIDRALLRPLQLSPCTPKDDIYSKWSVVRDEIIHAIRLKDIRYISCCRAGCSENIDDCPVTVLLGVNPKIQEWKVTRERVVTILDKHALTGVGVLIRKDSITRSVESYEGPAMENFLEGAPANMGFSLAPGRMQASRGTLGGWVELQNPRSGQWIPFALTCTHCVLPVGRHKSVEEEKVLHTWEKQGVPFGDSTAGKMLTVDSPSRDEITTLLDAWKGQIQSLEDDPLYKRVQAAHEKEDFVIPRDQAQWESNRRVLDILKPKRDGVKLFFQKQGYLLGSVMAASGLVERPLASVLRMDPKASPSTLDWALVRVRENRHPGENTIPPDAKQKFQVVFDKLTGFKHGGDIKANSVLMKVGHASGATAGFYNKLLTAMIATRIVDGKETPMVTHEHSIYPSVTKGKRSVIEHGDSGSFVFDHSGAVVGMAWGGNAYEDTGYFTEISDLIEDIKNQTGIREIRLLGGSY
ncbi:hypothetical protein BO70DRAFT_307080 [Aspergillus heteromorphus CBS 117.55]|uniref:Uncharacterized protein n=1 Tax=Aspergillus heteromorphus CBS 117.55 TaxID=1448321 RepID=A0A317X2N7_9EURO|nr:uncharacterized protein BO70DRAFT_307080 [Aspergillus heteromorphus CBS 117.55]PWY90810.1 hypothetical protein BO70DRAFT_307080 [Aspergillus heteromorphus CBS 117.55]